MSVPGQPVTSAPDGGPERLSRLFRRHAAGVAVVTVPADDGPVGLLVTSLSPVSARPPMLSFAVDLGSPRWPALRDAGYLGVHLLAAGQIELAERFSRTDADAFAAPTRWQPGPHGVPLVDGCAAWAVAAVRDRHPAGDHVILVADVLAVAVDAGERTLIRHEGAFHPVTAAGHRPAAPRRGTAGRLSVVRS